MHARNGCKVTNCMGLAVERSDQKCREGLVAVCSITIYLKEKKKGKAEEFRSRRAPFVCRLREREREREREEEGCARAEH